MYSYKLHWLLIWSSAFVLFGALAVVEAETLPLTGATAYDPEPVPDIDGFGWAFSTGTINPTEGQINHNSCAIAAYLGTAGISVFDGIKSGSFTVDRSGRYKLHISGFIDGEIREGSSASITGVSKSGGRLLIGGGLTTVEDSVLHETDFSNLAMITEMAWAAWIVFLDRIDETGVSAKLLSAIKDALTPRKLWNGEAFDLYSYDSLQAGIEYNWSFFVASAVAAGAFGNVKGVALYEANVYGLSVDLTYLGDDEFEPQTEVTTEGGYLSIKKYEWDDDSDGDDDGVMEAGEKVRLKVQLRSTGNIQDVDAVLRTSDSKVNITDFAVYYQPFSADELQWSVGWFDMDLNFELEEYQPRTSHFTLHLTYEKNDLEYYQDISFDKEFLWQGNHVWFEILSYTIDDSPSIRHRNNGDSTFQSSEKIHIRPLLRNEGIADASRIDVSVLYDGEVLEVPQQDRRYPNLAPSDSGYPENNRYFRISSTDYSFTGTVNLDVQVICDERSTPQVIKDAIQLDVKPAPVLSVDPDKYVFPVTRPGKDVTTDIMRVRNAGSGVMTVRDVQTSNNDTVVPEGDKSFTLAPGMERNISITIYTDNIPSGTTISREVRIISDGRIADMTSDRMIITGLVSHELPIFQVPGVTQGEYPDISGSWIVWQDSRNGNLDIYAYDISTETEHQITRNSGNQGWPRISGHLIAWRDYRNWDGTGEASADIYGYDLSTHKEFVISDDPAHEQLIGVDNGKVAFTRVYYVFTERSNVNNVSNLWLYDRNTEIATDETEFTSNTSHNPMHTVSAGDADFGGGLLVWHEYTVYWETQYKNAYWTGTDSRVRTMGVGLAPVQVLTGGYYPKSADMDRFVWVREDDNRDDQIWIWDNGSVRQVTDEETDHGEDVLAVGRDFIVYDKDSASGLFYWDLNEDGEFLLTEQLSRCEAARMDTNRVVLSSFVDSERQIYYAFLDGIPPTAVPEETDGSAEMLPQKYALFQNFPNPFNAFTTIRVQLPEASEVKLSVYNLLGQEVRRLVDGKVEAGTHSVLWDGRDEDGKPVGSGIYFSRLKVGEIVRTRKAVLLR